jgi:hypothetical protein
VKVKLNYSEICKSCSHQKEQGGTEGIVHNAHGFIRYNCMHPLKQWQGCTVHALNEWEWVGTHMQAYAIDAHKALGYIQNRCVGYASVVPLG